MTDQTPTAVPEQTVLDRTNPFAAPSTLPYQLPDFATIRDEHYLPAIRAGIAEHLAEIDAIAANPEPPTVENTVVALEGSGRLLSRAVTAFANLTSSHATPAIQDLDEEISPLLAAHHDAVYLDRALFARIEELHDAVASGELVLGEQDQDTAWLLHTLHTDFVRAGVRLGEAEQARLRELNREISSLQTAFERKLLDGANAAAVLVQDVAELDGLPEDAVAAARQAAADRGHDTGYLLELQLFSQQSVLASLRDRAVRERVHTASVTRGLGGGDNDTRQTVLALLRLRAERAALLGYRHHAAYVAEDSTARTTEAVMGMLTKLAPAAARNAAAEAEELQAALDADLPGTGLQPWDWAYCAEQVRRARFDIDDTLLRPYLELDNVLTHGVFAAAGQLYGLSFVERTDLIGYHPDVRVFEVFDADGAGLGLFLGDYYTRETKRGGAWMNNLVDQSTLLGQQPVVVNNLNIPKPPPGEPTLLTWDEVITAFHEFGHALHGLFSAVRYPSQSGTEVPRDFVEFPSQVNEMWAWEPSILRGYARHHATGEPMRQEWVDTVLAARQFNEGFATSEYLAAALLDQAWHQLAAEEVPDDVAAVELFEAQALRDAGLGLAAVPPRYRTAYFSHIFGGGYAAAYYSYIWSEVLDADTVQWFTENGGLRRENGDAFRATLLSRGGSLDVMDAFRALRGRDPDIAPLLARRGLDA